MNDFDAVLAIFMLLFVVAALIATLGGIGFIGACVCTTLIGCVERKFNFKFSKFTLNAVEMFAIVMVGFLFLRLFENVVG